MAHAASLARTDSFSPFNPLHQRGDEPTTHAMKKAAVVVLPATATPSISKVFMDYLGTWSGVKNALVKPIYTAADWIYTFFPHMKEFKQIAVLGKNTKNFASVGELPKNTVEAAKAVAHFAEKGDASSLGNLINRIGLLIMPAVDVLKVVSDTVRPLSAATARAVNTVFSIATVTTTSYGAVEELGKIAKNEAAIKEHEATTSTDAPSLQDRVVEARQTQITQSWLKIGMFTHYLAIGVLGLLHAFAGVAVPPFAIMALATNGLVFTLLGHFHNKLEVEPTSPVLAAASAVRV